jgi:hypothetical protein
MFKRIKNLLDISRYKVVTDTEWTAHGVKRKDPKLVLDVKRKPRPAIVVTEQYDPLTEFPDETTEQTR